jgi:hypothetical protein
MIVFVRRQRSLVVRRLLMLALSMVVSTRLAAVTVDAAVATSIPPGQEQPDEQDLHGPQHEPPQPPPPQWGSSSGHRRTTTTRFHTEQHRRHNQTTTTTTTTTTPPNAFELVRLLGPSHEMLGVLWNILFLWGPIQQSGARAHAHKSLMCVVCVL